MPDRTIRLRALLCHGVTLLWMPLAIGLVALAAHWQLTQIMFMASLSLATDGGHSPSFAVTVWLAAGVAFSQIFCLSLPLMIWAGCRKFHGLIHRSSQSAFNFQLSSLLYLLLILGLVAGYDRAGTVETDRDWASWLIPLVIGVLAFWNGMFSVIGMVRAWRGKLTRYPFAIPFIR
ncbi:DUF4870 domain-containing protein [Alkalinema pantanalense CENA528]|uniref:DUF4870 domain-containing protein n=1 Tax=Alkalinema pantanalense TaxID=1620705 RepID=UPI003D701D13